MSQQPGHKLEEKEESLHDAEDTTYYQCRILRITYEAETKELLDDNLPPMDLFCKSYWIMVSTKVTW